MCRLLAGVYLVRIRYWCTIVDIIFLRHRSTTIGQSWPVPNFTPFISPCELRMAMVATYVLLFKLYVIPQPLEGAGINDLYTMDSTPETWFPELFRRVWRAFFQPPGTLSELYHYSFDSY
ncbi:hypothetical protein CC2G_012220 [Coprinopsis cinerea AmutBmut pab1-1]|nr:hypothetical protein CC2G_012220 [Coprinopsis cinerea AmutBmut pab1-1]